MKKLLLFLILGIGCLSLPASIQAGNETPQVKDPAWLEVTPLASTADPVLRDLPDKPAAIKIDGLAAGLGLVCTGGGGFAVTCEQRYLEVSEPISPVLAKGVKVMGTLRLGKEPLPGARVAVVPRNLRSRRFVTLPLQRETKDRRRLSREVSSEGTGRFSLPPLAPGDYVFQVSAPGGRVLHQDVTVPRREALLPKGAPPDAEAVLALGEITFDPGVAVTVFVTSASGQPVPEAQVGGSQGSRPEDMVFFETKAGKDGKAQLSGLGAALPTSLVCLAQGYARWQQAFEAAPPSTVQCGLEALARIEGSVVDAEGEPVGGATLSSPAFGQATAATEKDGRFQLHDLPPGPYALTVAAPGFQSERLTVDVAAGEVRTLPPIKLVPGEEVRAIVRDAGSGEPVAGASVTSVDPPGAVDATSDGEGELIFTVGEDDNLRLAVSADDYPKTVVSFDRGRLDEEGRFVLELHAGGRLRLSVWDEEADTVCQGCSVGLQGPAGSESVVTDGQGEALSGPLAPGSYFVSPSRAMSQGGVVRVQGGQTGKRVDVAAGRTTPVSLGERLPLLQVRITPRVPDGWGLGAESAGGSRQAERLDDHHFQVRRPGEGAVTLSLHGATTVTVRLAVLPASDDRRQLDLSLPGGSVHGILEKNGEPLQPGRLLRLVAQDSTVRASALSDPGGSFSLPFLAPGQYTLLVDGAPVHSFALGEGNAEDLGRISVP